MTSFSCCTSLMAEIKAKQDTKWLREHYFIIASDHDHSHLVRLLSKNLLFSERLSILWRLDFVWYPFCKIVERDLRKWDLNCVLTLGVYDPELFTNLRELVYSIWDPKIAVNLSVLGRSLFYKVYDLIDKVFWGWGVPTSRCWRMGKTFLGATDLRRKFLWSKASRHCNYVGHLTCSQKPSSRAL